MKKTLVIAFGAGAAFLGAGAAPQLSDVAMTASGTTRDVLVEYRLTGEDAIVTFAVETNAAGGVWVPVEEKATAEAWGDVSKLVAASETKRAFTWSPETTFPDQVIAAGGARAVLTAWPTNTPPDYMVVGLTGAGNVRYFTSTNALPEGGLANDIYRRQYLVMRKIPARNVIWTKGGDRSLDSSYAEGDNLKPYRVKLTYDYYIGIYEFTRAQIWYVLMAPGKVKGTDGIYTTSYGDAPSDMRPADAVAFETMRTGNDPTDAQTTSTVCGRLRYWHGERYAFDVCTDSEWEYACRAGEPKLLYTGKDYSAANRDEIAWSYNNSGKALQRVGLKPPNRWGLYDMLGNATEYCLDKVETPAKYVFNWLTYTNDVTYKAEGYLIDPWGNNGTGWRIYRGCSCSTQNHQWTGSGLRAAENGSYSNYGWRLVCPVVPHWK